MTTFNRYGGGTANLPLGTLKRVIIPASGSSTLAEEANYDTIQENGTWIKENAVYLQSDYPALFDTIGLINAANFTPRSSGTTNNITAAVYGNNLWVLGSSGRYYASSTDAITWESNTQTPFTSAGIAYGNNVYVAAGFWGIATSTNGARGSWTAASVTTRSNTDLIYGNGKFVVISSTGNINYSSDGTTWTEVTPANVALRTIASTQEFFVAAGGSASNVWTSTDAVTWTVSTLGTTTNVSYRKIINDGTGLLLIGDSSAQFIGETSNQITETFTTPGTYSWTCPEGVTSVYVVCVGGGGGGATWSSGVNIAGAAGGGLGWKNVTVTPGQSYTVEVGAGGIGGGTSGTDGGVSYFIDTSTVAGFGGQGSLRNTQVARLGGSFVGDGGGNGGNGGTTNSTTNFNTGGAGGAGGYAGNGGNGASAGSNRIAIYTDVFGSGGGGAGSISVSFDSGSANGGGGGGVGLFGQGSSGMIAFNAFQGGGGGGSGGTDGTNTSGGLYGGAGGQWSGGSGRNGGSGGVSITYATDSAKKLTWKNLLNSGGHANSTISPMLARNNKILAYHSLNNQLVVTTSDFFSSVRTNVYPNVIASFGFNNNMYMIGGTNGVVLTSTDGGDNWKGYNAATTNTISSITFGAGVWVAGFQSGNINTSTNGIAWTSRTSNTTASIFQITFGNNLFVRAGNTGNIGTSTDAITWTARTSGISTAIRTVTYGLTWVYGADGGVIRTSPDGITWTARTSNTTSSIYSMTYGSNVGRYVAVGQNGLITTSTDAITWTTQTVSTITNRLLTNVNYDNGNFYVCGDSGIFLTTTNLSTWYFIGIPPSAVYGSPAGIRFANGLYVMSSESGFVFTSTDKILWTVPVRPTTSSVNSIEYANGVWTLAGTNGILGTSTDAVNWYVETDNLNKSIIEQVYNSSVIGNTIYYGTQGSTGAGIFKLDIQDQFTPYQYGAAENIFAQQNNFNTASQINKIIYENNNFIAVGAGGTIRQSIDGRSWYVSRWSRSTSAVSSIAYGNGIYVVVSSTSGVTQVSTDGYNWKPYGLNNSSNDVKVANSKILYPHSTSIYVAESTDPYNFRLYATGTTAALTSADFGNGVYVIVGASGTIRTSTNLYENWTARTSGTASTLRNVLYLNNNFIAVGDGGVMVTSTDAVTWTARTTGATTTIYSVAYGNNVYVAVGNAGYVRSSTDLVTWTARTAGSNIYYTVTYANNGFIAAGASGVIRTSTDGITWNLKTTGTTTILFSINYANNLYVAGGVNGTILTSTDAETWTATQSPTTSTINNILYANGNWIYTSQNGNIGVSTDAVNWNVTTRELFGYITFGNGLFVAATTTGIFTSTNNTNWISRATATTTIRNLTYQNNLYFYTGDSGMLATSTDAITWTARTTGTLQQINGVDYKDNLYAIVGNSGFFATSTDTITWITKVSGKIDNFLGIESNNSITAVLGNNGNLLTSADLNELEYSPAYDATTEFFVPNFTESQTIETIGGASEEHYVMVGGGTNLNIYPWSDETGFGARISTAAITVPTITQGAVFHPSMKAIIIGNGTLPVAIAWDPVSGFGTQYSSAAGALTQSSGSGGDHIAVSKTGKAVILVTQNSSGSLNTRWGVWPFDLDTGWGTRSTTIYDIDITWGKPKFHPNNTHLMTSFTATGSRITPWNDTNGWVGTTSSSFSSPYNYAYDWHPSGTRYVHTGNDGTNNRIYLYTVRWPENTQVSLYDNIFTSTGITGFGTLNFNPSGDAIVATLFGTNSARIRTWPFTVSGGVSAPYADPAAGISPSVNCTDAVFSPSGGAIVFTFTSSPFVGGVRWNNGYGTRYSDPSVLPTTAPVKDISFGTVTRSPTTFSQANQQTYIKAKL